MAQPEKISLWDRWFNRYRREIVEEKTESWYKTFRGIRVPNTDYTRNVVKYKVIDRVTGSEKIEIDYLN